VLDVAADSRQRAIVRASALWRLQHAGAHVPPDLLERAARDESPLVRRVAAGFPFPSTLGVLLGDRTLSVRLEAAGVLAQIPPGDLPSSLAGVRGRALEAYVAVQRFNADRPDGQLNMATGLGALGRTGEALAAMREAIRLDPTFVPAYVNLADAYRMQGDEAAAERVLREALPHAGSTGSVHHALGLTLVRQRRLNDALPLLAEAARREPGNTRFTIVHAVALHDAGRRPEALRVLKTFLSRRPDDRQAQELLETYSRGQ
jgi:Flp pilus assembly protein TadD